MNQQVLKLYSILEPPPCGLAGLVFERVHGIIAQQMLDDSMFEPNVQDFYRRISAASLETAYSGGYWIKDIQSQKSIFTQLAYFLHSSRPANPCLALSFIADKQHNRKTQLLTLLLYNEFQQPLGIYLHDDDIFLIYQNYPVEVASNFFYKECGSELIDHLRLVGMRYDLERLACSTALNHAFAFGFNKSFGHSHWNDVLGFLAVRHSPYISQSFNMVSHCLLGQSIWLPPKSLIDQVTLSCDTVSSCTDYLLSTRTCVHVPLGFSIGAYYEDYWRYQVTSEIQQSLKITLKNFRSKHWPIILFGLRPREWWRREWRSQGQQVLSIIEYLLSVYPEAGFIFDGLTAYHGQSNAELSSNKVIIDAVNERWGEVCGMLDIAGLPIEQKVATYKIVDYGITQFGSGDAIPHWVYSLPSITISAEAQIVSSYSNPEIITRQCKTDLRSLRVCGHFLPLECMTLMDDQFELDIDRAATYILNHLRQNVKPLK